MNCTDLVKTAIAEDLGSSEDITTAFFIPKTRQGQARIFTKESAILSGSEPANEVLRQFHLNAHAQWFRNDGDSLEPGQTILQISGSLHALLAAERTLLNFLQHLSGIATLTRRYVEKIAGTRAKILDTRKTLPGWRHLAKAAVKHGGGCNHRFGLYDQVLVKDNHLAALKNGKSDLKSIIQQIRKQNPEIKIEMEAETLEQVAHFTTLPIDIILLDNMPIKILHEAVKQIAGRCQTEASGGITLETVRAIAETGVDFISVGALTHSVKAIDFSMEIL
ncbi:MAG: carboxylating nicotinate-nucleotide diphosphorylase [Verrucomicrobiae bacterium]|nr:carboxylating nicotinate-nucleotide diphosphorylase [Verrucomicrobiae bacterium]